MSRLIDCWITDNHYHLVLQNTSGKMSEFAKRLNAVIQELEEEKDFRFGRTSLDRLEFKRLRCELLVRLKDRCGLMYSQIKYFPMFEDLKYSSMGQRYKRTKAGLEKEDS